LFCFKDLSVPLHFERCSAVIGQDIEPVLQPKTGRQTNKAMPLPLEGRMSEEGWDTGLVEDSKRSIQTFCVADAFNLKKLTSLMQRTYTNAEVHCMSECLHCRINSQDEGHLEEVFAFEACAPSSWAQ
jgi:uncharacterized Rmd1/YagE family protein